MNELQGRVVLITGASAGFGREMALKCTAAGAKVALCARRLDLLQQLKDRICRQGGTAIVHQCDATQEDQVLATIKDARTQLGDIDVLVNNVGMNLPARRIVDTSARDWQSVIDGNLTSAFLFTKPTLAQMIERRTGSIIFIVSRAATEPSLLAGAAYSSAKKALLALARVTNEEGNPHNVRASVINPGVGNTAIIDVRPDPPPTAVRNQMVQGEDVANAVIFVASLPQRVNVERLDINPTDRTIS